VLDKGAKTIPLRLKDKPVVRVRLMEAIGSVYAGLGLRGAAEPLLREVLAIQERTYGSNSPEVATALLGVGGLEDVRRALAIREKVLGPRHIETAYTEWLIGVRLIWPVGESTEVAKQHLERALEIYRSIPGKGDKGASWCLNDLGNTLAVQGRYNEALPYFREALSIKERILGPEHPDVAIGLNGVGNVLLLLGRYSEARPLFERAVLIGEKSLGPWGNQVGAFRYNLGDCLSKMGRTTEARDVLERALKISEQREPGTESPEAPLVHYGLAAIYVDLGLDARAEPHFRAAVDHVEQLGVGAVPTSELADWFEKYADLLDRGGRAREAATFHARAKRLRLSAP
jgi:tetratricopeptide (TPR) repeat protein